MGEPSPGRTKQPHGKCYGWQQRVPVYPPEARNLPGRLVRNPKSAQFRGQSMVQSEKLDRLRAQTVTIDSKL